MSFFLQGKRNTDFPKNSNPSPFQYTVTKANQKSNSFAPFSTTTKLNRTQKIQKENQPNLKEQQPMFLTEDLKQLAQQRMQAMFKSRSQRFLSDKKIGPGPGAYDVRSKLKISNKKRNNSDKNSQSMSIMQKKTTPTIPTDSLGYKLQNQQYKKVQPPQQKIPVPGSYELQKDFIVNKGLIWKKNSVTGPRYQDYTGKPGPGTYEVNDNQNKKAPSSCFQSKTNRFDPKKIKKSYQPGPGQYQPKPLQKNRFNNSQTHFNSKIARFEKIKEQNVGPGSYNAQRTRSMKIIPKKNQSKNIYRKTLFDEKNPNPGPGQYIPYQGMTFELQKALLRKHNQSQFPNGKRQVFEPQKKQQPGPGEYNPEKIKGLTKGNLGYKKPQVVILKEDDIDSPSPFDYKILNNTIQKNASDSVSKLTLTERKPFNCGSQRFTHYSNKKKNIKKQTAYTDDEQTQDAQQQIMMKTNMLSQLNKKTKKLVMTSVKVKVPFGTSTSKYAEPHQTQTGPGQYNVQNRWLKKTYSIKGKLNSK